MDFLLLALMTFLATIAGVIGGTILLMQIRAVDEWFDRTFPPDPSLPPRFLITFFLYGMSVVAVGLIGLAPVFVGFAAGTVVVLMFIAHMTTFHRRHSHDSQA